MVRVEGEDEGEGERDLIVVLEGEDVAHGDVQYGAIWC